MGKKYEEQLQGHPVHTAIKTLEDVLNKALAAENAAPHLDDLKKIQKALIFIRERLIIVDPSLVAVGTLNTLNTSFANTATHIKNFLANSQPQQIANALSNIDSAISLVPSLLSSSNDSNIVDITKEQIDSFLKHVSSQMNYFDKTLKGLENNYGSINSIAENSKILSDDTKAQSNQLITDLQKKNQNVISDFQKQWQRITSEIQNQFSQKQTERSDKFEKTISEYKEKLSLELKKIIDSHNQKLDENFTAYNDRINSILKDSAERHSRIVKLYQIVASDSVGGAYKKTADDELTTANKLRKSGLQCLSGGAIWILICILMTLLNGVSFFGLFTFNFNVTIYHAIPATTITFIILSIGAYLLFQSEKHRKTSLWANQVNLEINAFEPFIDSMEDDDKRDMRKALTGQLFGHISNPQNTNEKIETGLPIERIIELFEKLPEGVKNKFFPS